MDYRRFGNTVVARIDIGEEVLDMIKQIALKEDIKLAHVSAIGATDDLVIGVYSIKDQTYDTNEFKGFYEIVSLSGNINTMNGEFYTHMHIACADKKGNVIGGHLNKARIGATCEMFITVIDGSVDRKRDESIGINLFSFE